MGCFEPTEEVYKPMASESEEEGTKDEEMQSPTADKVEE